MNTRVFLVACLLIPFTIHAQRYKSPAGLILSSSNCSDACCAKQEGLYLFEDGRCVLQKIVNEWNYDKLTYFGTWSMSDSIIQITYSEMVGGEGIGAGKPNSDFGCHGLGYERYRAFRKNINDVRTINWNEFKKEQTSFISPIKTEKNNLPQRVVAESERFGFFHSPLSENLQLLYSQQYLASLNKAELRFLRNEIFARYGFIFNSVDLSEFFKGKSWYRPTYVDVTAYLTEIDKKNIALINSFEARVHD
jgi:hypothetical protein